MSDPEVGIKTVHCSNEMALAMQPPKIRERMLVQSANSAESIIGSIYESARDGEKKMGGRLTGWQIDN